jgi:NitT/TauT family transport system permease protein
VSHIEAAASRSTGQTDTHVSWAAVDTHANAEDADPSPAPGPGGRARSDLAEIGPIGQVPHSRALAPALWRAGGIAVALLIWQILTWTQALGAQFGAAFAPTSAALALVGMIEGGDLFRHLLPSLQRVLIGLLIASLIGVPVGVLVGYSRRLEWATTPVFQFLRMVSPLAWMPIAIIAFGIGDHAIYFLLAATAVWPIVLSTAHGVSSLDPIWLKVARNLGASESLILRRIVVPAVLGDILTGLRVAVGICWVVLVPAEMLGVSAGLGYYVLDTRDRFRYDELMAVILVIGFTGFILDALVRKLKGRFAWKDALLV